MISLPSQQETNKEQEMTNIYETLDKVLTRRQLFQAGLSALESKGWRVERIARSGKASIRRITKGNVSKTVSIRTTQDQWVAFPRNANDDGWATLADADDVVVVSVDDRTTPQFAQVHLVPGDEMRQRFDRAYQARKGANHVIPVGRGIWLSLYEKESESPISLVGGGIGLAYPAIARIPLSSMKSDAVPEDFDDEPTGEKAVEPPFTIAEAKRRLALSLGVNESDVKITITG
jgi:hypothetical protein